MLEQVFMALLISSCVGTALAVLLMVFRPLTKRYFSSNWQYYMWLMVLFVMVLPVRFAAPVPTRQPQAPTMPQAARDVQPGAIEQTPVQYAEPAAEKTVGQAEVQNPLRPLKAVTEHGGNKIALVWLAGALLLLFTKNIRYILFLRTVRRTSEPVSCPELVAFTDKKVITRVSSAICAPLMTGIFKPTLLLPKIELTDEQLHAVLAHEMTHFKRKDLLYKWFALVVKCIHWFNPAVYFINRQINMECEISCDLAVVAQMDKREEIGYMNTILTLLSAGNAKTIPLTTGMTGKKDMLKRRFMMIKNRTATSRTRQAVSAVLAAAVLLTTVFVSGVLANSILGEQYDIEVSVHGTKAALENKPFIAQNTVYLPLREMLNLEGIADGDITYDNGYIQFFVRSETPIEYRGDIYDFWVNRVQIGSVYAYIGGHSYGSTENTALLSAPVLRDGVTYVPYDLFDEIRASNQGVFLDTIVTAGTNDDTVLAGMLYRNDEMNFQLELPLNWCGKYQVEAGENEVRFIHTDTRQKYEGAGTLFYVYKTDSSDAEAEVNAAIGNRKIIWQNSRDAYILGTPTDVQYPIWGDRDEEDVGIAKEYEEMIASIALIEKSFDVIVRTVGDENVANAEQLSFSALQQLQEDVNNGHYPWRLNFAEVLMEFVHQRGIGGGEITAFFAEDGLKATYIVDGTAYTAEGFQPIQQDGYGIWVIKSIEHAAAGEPVGRTGMITAGTALFKDTAFNEPIAELHENDLVFVLFQNAHGYYVQVPVMEVPALAGYVPLDAVTFDERAFADANYGVLKEGAVLYNTPDINDIYSTDDSGVIAILERTGDWVLCNATGGIDRKWVRAEHISYQLGEE